MKKKIKIFSTIASLCLAIALMAFGVYAATSIEFSAKSTVSFTATEIDGIWSMKIAGGDNTEYKSGEEDYSSYNEVIKSNGAETNNEEVGKDAEVVALPALKIAEGEGKDTITYSVKFENTGSADATIVVSFTELSVAGYSLDFGTATGKTADDLKDKNSITLDVAGTATEDAEHTAEVTIVLTLDVTATDFNEGANSSVDVEISAKATKKV